MIRVLVKASSAVAQAGLEALLRPHPSIQVVPRLERMQAGDEDSNVRDFGTSFDAGSLDSADIVLAEIEDLGDWLQRDGLEEVSTGSRVILLAHQPAAGHIAEMLRAGVRSVLPANLNGSEIVAAIEAVYAGLMVLHPGDVDVVAPSNNHLSNPTPRSATEPLTSRETEVLQFLALGLANKEIAGRMKISEHTVKFHVASILGKLGASSRTEAVMLGIRQGLVMI
jgi:DNA-binding NarL/FixJ family response regulator